MGNIIITPVNPIVWAGRPIGLIAWGNGSGTGSYSWTVGGSRQSSSNAMLLYTPATQESYPVQLTVDVTDTAGNTGTTTLIVVDASLYGNLDFLTYSPDGSVILGSYTSPDAERLVASLQVSSGPSTVPGAVQSFVSLCPTQPYTQVMPSGIYISCYVLNVAAIAASTTANWEQN